MELQLQFPTILAVVLRKKPNFMQKKKLKTKILQLINDRSRWIFKYPKETNFMKRVLQKQIKIIQSYFFKNETQEIIS